MLILAAPPPFFSIEQGTARSTLSMPHVSFSVQTVVGRMPSPTHNNAILVQTEPIQIQNFIDGGFIGPASGRYLDNIEPATGKPYSQVADSDLRDVELAVASAEKAFAGWSRTPTEERSRIILRIADLIERDLKKILARRIDRHRQTAFARASARNSARYFQLPLFCHGDSAHGKRSAHDGWRGVQLHAAPTARRCRFDFSVEPAALFVELENRARTRSW